MKRVIIIFLVSFSLISCMRGWYADRNENIELSEFSKECISLYLNDSIINSFYTQSYDEITLRCYLYDTLMYFNIYQNRSEIYKHICYECFVGDLPYLGRTSYSGKTVRVFGEENPMFLHVYGKARAQGKCRKEYWEFDPIEWFVVFNRDSSFCKAETNLWEETDMTPVLELANNYFGTAPSVKK